MEAERVAELLKKNQTIAPMSDTELKELYVALRFLWVFNLKMGFSPEAIYYGQEMERVGRIIEARKDRQ